MRKEEFLQNLRRSLNGDVPPRVVEENIRYYDNYITDEVRKGRSEEAVIDEIGDPRLIARTIEDTTDGAGENLYQETYSYESSSRGAGDEREPDPSYTGGSIHFFNLNKWYWKLLFWVILFGIMYLIFIIVGGIFSLLAPLLGPILLIWMVVWIIRNYHQR